MNIMEDGIDNRNIMKSLDIMKIMEEGLAIMKIMEEGVDIKNITMRATGVKGHNSYQNH
jgi:hypothetical protein